MSHESHDIIIVGAGMVGISLAHQLIQKFPKCSILLIDKEKSIGFHSSGRNSGVLHAGIYYEPNSLKAKVCVKGALRLKEWCLQKQIPILKCGKVITPQDPNLDSSLDLLLERGKKNGAQVRIINESEFYSRVPDGFTSTGRALFSPNTCVVNPKVVLSALKEDIEMKGARFLFGAQIEFVNTDKNELLIRLVNGEKKLINYGYLYNTAGLNSDKVASMFDVGKDFTLLPFKGIYWQLDPNSPFTFRTNLYPVPDLRVPFLGVHVTPSVDGLITLGPTAIPALGRENYDGLRGFEPLESIRFFGELAHQWIANKNGFRKYSYDQALHGIKPFFLAAARKLIPKLRDSHLIPSKKVGIRAQLFDTRNQTLIQDFRLEHTHNSTHVLNAISPAFTASFELADLIIDRSINRVERRDAK